MSIKLKDTANITATSASSATSATKLQTARAINGTNFDGTGNITTANWGTARTLTIGNTGKSVNGSGNVSWSLSEIGAAPAGYGLGTTCQDKSKQDCNNILVTGFYRGSNMTNKPSGCTQGWIYLLVMSHDNSSWVRQVAYDFGTASQVYTRVKQNGSWTSWVATDNNTWRGVQDNLTSTATDQSLSANQGKVLKGLIDGKAASNHTHNYAGSSSAGGNANAAVKLATARTINGTNFDGTGNITTANWGTARNIQIGNTSKSVNGSGNVSWSLSEIGAAAANHTHSYAPISHEQDYAGTNSNTYIAYPKDGRYRTNASSLTGYLKITLPHSWTSTMMRFEVDIYNYITNETMTYILGGYNYNNGKSSGWVNCTACCITHSGNPKRNLTVRFGHDGTKCAIYIGEASTTWAYTQVTVKNITVGFGNYALTSWNSGWAVGFTTTLGTITGTATNPYVGNGGMASTANTLATARTINGTNFNGSANITTANWGTARNITIADNAGSNTGAAVSVNGSGNVTLKLPATIAASLNGNASTATALTTSAGSSTQPIYFSGGKPVAGLSYFARSTQGDIGWGSANNNSPVTVSAIAYWNGAYQGTASNLTYCKHGAFGTIVTKNASDYAAASHTHNYVPTSDVAATATANKVAKLDGSADINVRLLRSNYANQSTISGALAYRVNNGSDNYLRFCSDTAAIRTWLGAAASNHTHNYAASSSAGGNANAAVKLATARTINGTNFDGSVNITTANWGAARNITIGNTAKSVNGSANVSWSLSEIGAAASNHTHSYLPLSGGTMSGYIQLPSNGGSWLNGATNGNIRGSKQSTGSYHPIISQTTSSGHKVSLGGLGDDFGFHVYDKNRTENGIDKYWRISLGGKDIYTNMRFTVNDDWLYTTGNTGWYNATHAGGWYMSDSSWIRAYNNKNIYTAGTVQGWASRARYVKALDSSNNLDFEFDSGTGYFNVYSSSGCGIVVGRPWSGSSGTEPALYNNKGNNWGFIGNSGNAWFRVYGSGGSVSDRNKKYHITKALHEEQYENVKNLNIYNYRTISTSDISPTELAEKHLTHSGFMNEEGKYVTTSVIVEEIEYKELEEGLSQDEIKELRIKEIIEKNPHFSEVRRQDLMLGAMVDELPTEVTFYDNEGGDGKAVDMYSYTTMIAGAVKHLIDKVEQLEKENEELKNKIENQEV